VTEFSTLKLHSTLLKNLEKEGYKNPTPIQLQAIPDLLDKKDLLGIAQTGTGKTAAFSLPILHRLALSYRPLTPRACRALILSPTRELAGQILESLRTYGRSLKLSSDVVYGGIPINRQIRALAQGVDILVATPGRLLDLVNQRALSLAKVEILVLDEADQMLDMGFIHDIRQLDTHIPKARQTMLFSATMPKAIADLAANFLKNPLRVEVTPVATTAERVDQSVIFVETAHKQSLLHALLEDQQIDRALVFTRTKHGADRVVRRLEAHKVPAAAIHGNKSQPQRERALADFKSGKLRILVATDIAARGIDIDQVSNVINFDLPNVPESYVHRIGRTARAGASGIAISFCDREERAYLRDIEKVTRQKIPVLDNPLGPDFVPPPELLASGKPQRSGPATKRTGAAKQGRGYHASTPAASGKRREEADVKRWVSDQLKPAKNQNSRSNQRSRARRSGS
jgi:ATP-dependent RNA helicase RhlE